MWILSKNIIVNPVWLDTRRDLYFISLDNHFQIQISNPRLWRQTLYPKKALSPTFIHGTLINTVLTSHWLYAVLNKLLINLYHCKFRWHKTRPVQPSYQLIACIFWTVGPSSIITKTTVIPAQILFTLNK